MDKISIFDVLIMCSGLYLIYTAVIMKTRGEITKGVIISKNVNVERMRDKDGFIRYMSVRAFLIGAWTAAAGAANLINSYVQGPVWVSLAAVMGYIAALIVFAVLTVRAGKKFIG